MISPFELILMLFIRINNMRLVCELNDMMHVGKFMLVHT